MRASTTLLVFVAVALVGCGGRRNHIVKAYGDSSRAFAVQRERIDKAPAIVSPGLDPLEAPLILDTYRASMVPKGAKAEEEPAVIMVPASRERPQKLAPSVPKE